MSRLYLIRHGRPSAGWGGVDGDPGLDEIGRAQARAAAGALAMLPPGVRPLRVVASPLRRCRETAEPLARVLSVALEIDPRVGEIPTPALLPPAARPAWLRSALTGRWSQIEGDIDYEAWRAQVTRSLTARARTAVFSHFVAINAVLSTLASDERVIVFRPDHASVTTLELLDGRLALIERGVEAATGVL